MAGKLNSHVLDTGLSVLKSEATDIYICSQEPTTYAEATSTYALGHKTFGAGAALTGPADATPNGRKLTTVAVTDGVITSSGTAARYAIVDTINNRLLVDQDLSASQAVTAGNSFSLPGFDVRQPSS